MSAAIAYPVAEAYVRNNDKTRAEINVPAITATLGGVAAAVFAAAYFKKIGKILTAIGTVVPLGLLGVVYMGRRWDTNNGVLIFDKKMDEQMKEFRETKQLTWLPAPLFQFKALKTEDADVAALQALILTSPPKLPHRHKIEKLIVAEGRSEPTYLDVQLVGQTSAWAGAFLEAREKGLTQARQYAAKQLHDGLQLIKDPQLEALPAWPAKVAPPPQV